MRTGGISAATMEDRIDGPASWTIERDAHLLILHEAGSYHYLETWLDGRRTSLGDPLPGEIWLIPAGHCYRAAARGGFARYVAAEIPAARLTVARETRGLAGHRDVAMAALIRGMASGEAGVAESEAVLALIERALDGAAGLSSPATAQRIDALMPFIEANIESHLTVEHMAAKAGMSVNSLIVHFARATGHTPGQYLLRQRLRRACWYLANRPLSVAEIAFATGFSSHAHLCAAFRSRFAMSPSEWRRHFGTEPRPSQEN